MKGLFAHRKSLAISTALAVFISNTPIFSYSNLMQRFGLIFVVTMIIYSMIWLEGDK